MPVTFKEPIRGITGKMMPNTHMRQANNKTFHPYYADFSHRPEPTEAMRQTRTNLTNAQSQAAAILADPEQKALWEERFKKAQRDEARHPGSYANQRRKAMEEKGMRIRPKSLVLPNMLRGFIISNLMLHPSE